ncbi:choice-of-anchor P family protein [Actinomadura alba]|uniref:Uncharacterized protein n=1 Tax=Actinomadura alba TaxID=406431 RepID=A0ABR7LTC8_9ACTN|nr:choice-of-anchor P family protein [Actinomadura alba]MBC6468110.1 hypothetical protein [Actinomadura alba]
MRLTHLTKYAAVAGVAAMPLIITAAPAAYATNGGYGSAYGISATGPVAIPPTPSVSSTAKQPTRKSLAELPANPLADASVLSVAAWAGHGRASVADLKLANAALSAKLIFAKCENRNGVTHLGKVVLNGQKLKVSPKPNSAITVSLANIGTASATLNKQVRNPDGGLTVTAIELSLPIGPGKTQTVSIASVTCGPTAPSHEPTPPGDPNQTPAPSPTPTTTTPPAAPVPTPVTGDLPVTG